MLSGCNPRIPHGLRGNHNLLNSSPRNNQNKRAYKPFYTIPALKGGAFGCKQPEPLLDTNTVRVYERLFNYKLTKHNPYRDKGLMSILEELVPRDPEEAYEFNLGVMDLGFRICGGEPRCVECPLRSRCNYYSVSRGITIINLHSNGLILEHILIDQ